MHNRGSKTISWWTYFTVSCLFLLLLKELPGWSTCLLANPKNISCSLLSGVQRPGQGNPIQWITSEGAGGTGEGFGGRGYSGGSKFVVDSSVPGVSKDSMGFGDSKCDGDFRYECCFHRLCQLQFILLFLEVWGDGSCRAEQRKEGCWNRSRGEVPTSERDRILSLSLSTELKAVWSKGLASPFIKIPMVGACHPVFSY